MNSVQKGNLAEITNVDFCKEVDLILHDILLKIVLNKINVACIKWTEHWVTCIQKQISSGGISGVS